MVLVVFLAVMLALAFALVRTIDYLNDSVRPTTTTQEDR